MTDLKRFIQKLHLRTFSKIYPHVKENFPDATEQQVKDIIKTFVKDPKNLNQKQYYNKIFSDHLHSWMCDLLDNKGATPDYNNKAEKEAKAANLTEEQKALEAKLSEYKAQAEQYAELERQAIAREEAARKAAQAMCLNRQATPSM